MALSDAALAASADWSAAFPTQSGSTPALYLRATYPDAGSQQHTLEFWRDGQGRVVRRTDDRVELRLSPAADGEDAYQLRDLTKHLAYDVHRINLYRIGIFTDRWSTQHLLDQPHGAATLELGAAQTTAFGACRWTQIVQAQGPATEVCWSSLYGVPLLERRGTQDILRVTAVRTADVMLPSAVLPEGWQAFDADEDIAPD